MGKASGPEPAERGSDATEHMRVASDALATAADAFADAAKAAQVECVDAAQPFPTSAADAALCDGWARRAADMMAAVDRCIKRRAGKR